MFFNFNILVPSFPLLFWTFLYVNDSWSCSWIKRCNDLKDDFIVISYMPTPSLQEEEHQTLPNLSWFGLNQEEALNGYPSSDICQSS